MEYLSFTWRASLGSTKLALGWATKLALGWATKLALGWASKLPYRIKAQLHLLNTISKPLSDRSHSWDSMLLQH